MTRVVAICKGGPLEGQLLSVPTDEEGRPGPMFSRAELLGVLYVPTLEAELADEHRDQFRRVLVNDDGEPILDEKTRELIVRDEIAHDGAWLFEPADEAEAAELIAAHQAAVEA